MKPFSIREMAETVGRALEKSKTKERKTIRLASGFLTSRDARFQSVTIHL